MSYFRVVSGNVLPFSRKVRRCCVCYAALCSVDKRERFGCGFGCDTDCTFFFYIVLNNYTRFEVFTAVLMNIPVV